ncbi:hypothetical protein [Cryobacterium fucosi]|uniref:Uncharacterized protein n=1 Tax=Cryobacterium fucosi TaxID=1259157 RepID=A0A4R9BDR2_9MICO|nr:hypothetical protein [Cryobacterium fucosi]TFD81266.1 hypothetical protein E3T48_03585 [Cryobacterium fucosi]
MSDSDEQHPELSGYEPQDADRPLRSRRALTFMRIVVVLGVVALIVPGILTSLQIASATAENTCRAAVLRYHPFAVGSHARFELSGPGGFGWQCYAIDVNERATYVIPLGIIPSAPGALDPGIPA